MRIKRHAPLRPPQTTSPSHLAGRHLAELLGADDKLPLLGGLAVDPAHLFPALRRGNGVRDAFFLGAALERKRVGRPSLRRLVNSVRPHRAVLIHWRRGEEEDLG